MTNEHNRFIKVKVKFFATLKEVTKKSAIEIEEKTTIFYLLEKVFYQFDTLKEKILDDNNELRKWINILKNGRNIKFLDGIETKLNDGDVIAIFPPVAGGRTVPWNIRHS